MGVIISESDGGTKKKLKKEIKKFKGGVKDGVAIELEKVMRKIRDDAVAICPKETGTLASTIRIASVPTGMMTGAWSRIKEIMLFDKSIIAGDITKINPKSGRPVDYACFTKDNFVVSNPDVIQISNLTNDKIIYSNGSFERVEGIKSRLYDGNFYKIYRYKSSFPLELTAEHRVFAIRSIPCPYHKGYTYFCRPSCKYHKRNYPVYKWCKEYEKYKMELIEAKDLKVGDYLVSPIFDKIEDRKVSKEICRLIGYFCADGNIDGKYYVRFTFNGNEKEFINDVDNLMFQEFGKHTCKPQIRIGPDGGSYTLVYCCKEAVKFFKQFYHPNKKKYESGRKYFPRWIMSLPLEKQKEIICGLYRGDGLKGINRKRLGVVSRILAEQTRIILERLGFSPSFRIDKRKYPNNDCYLVEITGNELFDLQKIINDGVEPKIGKLNREYCIKTPTYIAYPIRKIDVINKNEKVWDVQVANKHSLVVNGCLVANSWVHDGHVMRDGSFWSGVPFLTEAIAMNEKELNDAINRALKKLGKNYSD